MGRKDALNRLQILFRDVFDDESIIIDETTRVEDVQGWDSLMNITILAFVQEEFSVSFDVEDVKRIMGVSDILELVLGENI